MTTTEPDHAVDVNRLLDTLMAKLGAHNDRQLSKILNIAPPSISKMRHGRACVSSDMLIRMHDASQLSINELRAMMKPEIEKNNRAQGTSGARRRKALG